MNSTHSDRGVASRRSVLAGAFGALGWSAFDRAEAEAQERVGRDAPVAPRERIKITKLETLLVKPRWLFLKVHTNAGIVGLGEPIVEGRAETVADGDQGDRALPGRQGPAPGGPSLAGDLPPRVLPRRPDPHQRPERHRHGPLGHQGQGAGRAGLRAAGRADARPGPRLRARRHARSGSSAAASAASPRSRPARPSAGRRATSRRRPRCTTPPRSSPSCARPAGDDVDIAIDFHGAISPATAKLLIKALEPYQPMFVEEPCQAQNHDVMAEIARGTHLPIATGERVFTKWGFREVLEKRAATILQPDLCHAGGITEVRLIAGMAEAYYAAIAPHNPLGPDLAGRRRPDRRVDPQLPLPGAGQPGRGLPEEAVHRPRQGYLDLPTGPGLGIELDENALADKIGHDWKNRESYDADDGSVVDW